MPLPFILGAAAISAAAFGAKKDTTVIRLKEMLILLSK